MIRTAVRILFHIFYCSYLCEHVTCHNTLMEDRGQLKGMVLSLQHVVLGIKLRSASPFTH